MPAMRILVNTSAPQGSTGITANVFPAMTLGCGAVAGNITGDNIGPQHLINTKRLAYVARNADEAFETSAAAAAGAGSGTAPRAATDVGAAVDRWLERKGMAGSSPVEEVVDRFLRGKKSQPATAAPGCPVCPVPAPAASGAAEPPPAAGQPAVAVADFVCENDVRTAINRGAKIYIGPKTIVTPAARDLAAAHDILVTAQR
jgi:hypothetical protein